MCLKRNRSNKHIGLENVENLFTLNLFESYVLNITIGE